LFAPRSPFAGSTVPWNVKFRFKCGLGVQQCESSLVELGRGAAPGSSDIGCLLSVPDLLPFLLPGEEGVKSPDLGPWLGSQERSKGGRPLAR
jgi:hypothetical protein